MQEEKKSKLPLAIAVVALVVVGVGVGIYLTQRERCTENCECEVYAKGHDVEMEFQGANVGGTGHALDFHLDDWCEEVPESPDSICITLWKVSKLKMEEFPQLPAGTEVKITFHNPPGGNHSARDTILTYHAGTGEMDLSGSPLYLYEGADAWLQIGDPGIAVHLDRGNLRLGGLCIVENIDGGDIDTKSPSDTQTEPVMAKTGGVDTTKVKTGS